MAEIYKKTDEELMLSYVQGDESAFNELYNRYKGKVYGYLLNRVRDQTNANDIFQSIFLKFHRTRDLYNVKYPVSKWIFTIVTTSLIDTYRSMGRHRTEKLPDDIATDPGQPVDLGPELDKLSEPERNIIKLRYLDDKSFEEISQILGKTEINVRKILSRATLALRKIIPKGGG
jgi:RNA polymerase sigma-70 factor, ECF subfamily